MTPTTQDRTGLSDLYRSRYLHKFDSPFTAFLYERYVCGWYDDEYGSVDEDGVSVVRMGRYALVFDSQGFVSSDRPGRTQPEFIRWIENNYPHLVDADDTDDDDDSEEDVVNPYAGPGGLLDEVRQSERMLGDA